MANILLIALYLSFDMPLFLHILAIKRILDFLSFLNVFSHHHRPQRAMHSKGSPKAQLSFQPVHEPFWYKLWTAEHWASFHRTNLSKYSTGSTVSLTGLEATQDRQIRRLKFTARLSSFNWSLAWAFFWKTIVWDAAFISLHFTQTGVTSSQKG